MRWTFCARIHAPTKVLVQGSHKRSREIPKCDSFGSQRLLICMCPTSKLPSLFRFRALGLPPDSTLEIALSKADGI